MVNQAKDLDENLELALQMTVPVYLKVHYCKSVLLLSLIVVLPILGVDMLLRLPELNTFQSMVHDFQNHNNTCLIMIVRSRSYIF